MAPTVYTVAKKAGVSVATVSRVLNNSPKVKEKTRARVLKIADELNYQPNASARGLALKRTDIIALIFPDISGPFYSEVIRGVESETGRHNYNVLIYGTHGKDSSARFLRDLSAKVDGLILMARSVEDKYALELRRRRVPFVLLDREIENIEADCILVNNSEGAYTAMQHLLEHEYRRIAFVGGPPDSPDSKARFEGYRQALQEHGIACQTELIEHGDFQQLSGYQAMLRLLEQPTQPTAVFAANDEMAIGAMDATHHQGLRIPEDIAFVGFDDIQVASFARPPLTTVRQPMRELGALAAKSLLRRIRAPKSKAETIQLSTEFIIRRSCGCT